MSVALLFLLAWIPVGHPLHGTAVDGCTVGIPALTIVSVRSSSWTVEWDTDGDGVFDRSEVHWKRSDRWSNYGDPILFDPGVETVLRWRVTLSSPPDGDGWYFPHAMCPFEVWPGGVVNWLCWDTRDSTGATGRAVFNRQSWSLQKDHPGYNIEGYPCPELEPPPPPPPEIFSDDFESGNLLRWSRSVGWDPALLFRDGFESGDTRRWSHVKGGF